MAAKAPQIEKVSSSDLIRLIAERLDGEVPQKTIRTVVKAIQEEAEECVREGYRVDVLGLVTVNFGYTESAPKRKGDNPFTGEKNVTLKARPEKLRVKVSAGRFLKSGLPSPKSAVGKRVKETLTAQAAARAKAAKKKAKAK